MTHLSQMFGLSNGGDDLHLDNMSAADDSDDENRDDEIKKMLADELNDGTFEYESDTSSHNASRFSNHNDCSFVSTSKSKSKSDSSSKVLPELPRKNGNGDFLTESHQNEGLFQTPKFNNNERINLNPNGLGGPVKRVEFSALPNSIPPSNNGPVYAKNNGIGGLNGNGLNGNGNHSSPSTPSPIFNGNGILNGIRGGWGKENGLNRKTTSLVDQNQSNCEVEEIEVPNPTISLLHKDHCPQGESEGLISDGIWLSSENTVEQLKEMCKLRERQIQRTQEDVQTLQKDKRALYHQIGIMKTEMVQMRSQCEEAEKFAQLKDEEVLYLKSKIQEAIEEFEQARRNEIKAKDDSNRLLIEIDQMRLEVKQLSALGSSTQQAEVNDVVRQLREKHARDMASWQKVVAELEGQISTYKRSQLLLHEESITIAKESVQTQTEYQFEEEIERRERELAAQEFQEEFGSCGEAFLNDIKILPEREIVKRVRQEWKAERDKIVNHFQSEIKVYKQRLATLPNELYQMWKKTQEEYGLNNPVVIKPLCRSVSTITDQKLTRSPILDKSTSMMEIEDSTDGPPPKETQSQGVQVNFAAVLASSQETEKQPTTEINDHTTAVDSQPRTSNVNSHVEEKETSSVIVQTDETLETYKILASLIDNWSREVNASKQRAEFAEGKTRAAEEEVKGLNKKFKHLQKLAVNCRKEWKKQEDNLRTANTQMKAHYVEMLQHLNDKLDVAAQIEL